MVALAFPKDVAAFRHISDQLGVDFSLLAGVERINTNQKRRFLSKVHSVLWTLRGKKIGILGLAFKGGTDDIRESPAIDIARTLIAEGCIVQAFDPAAMEKAQEALPSGPQVKDMHDIYSAVQGVDAALILTDWNVFSRLNLKRLKEEMRCPIVVDGMNLYDPQTMVESGIIYVSLGRPTMDIAEEPLLLARLA